MWCLHFVYLHIHPNILHKQKTLVEILQILTTETNLICIRANSFNVMNINSLLSRKTIDLLNKLLLRRKSYYFQDNAMKNIFAKSELYFYSYRMSHMICFYFRAKYWVTNDWHLSVRVRRVKTLLWQPSVMHTIFFFPSLAFVHTFYLVLFLKKPSSHFASTINLSSVPLYLSFWKTLTSNVSTAFPREK